jgi:hypothetical protein
LAKISSDEVAAPHIPVDRLIGEAKALAKVATTYLDALLKVGIARALVTTLEDRANALAEAQSEFISGRGASRGDEENALEAKGYKLRSDMVADLRYAARADHDVQSQLDMINEGDGHDDLVQDLRDLSVLFGKHAKELKKASVDAKGKGADAKKIAASLEKLTSTRRAGKPTDGAAKDLRDRAATYLEHALSEIRAAGVYAFRDKPAMQAKFRSPYAAAQRANTARRKKAATAAPTAPAPA